MATKKQRRIQLLKNANREYNQTLTLGNINPLTINQRRAFVQFNNKNLLLHGYAGTGKTFIAMYLALKELERSTLYKKIVIFRSAVPARDLGFLPGNLKEKMAVYEEPYQTICRDLYGRSDAYNLLKSKKCVEFYSTSFVRGITLDDCIIIVDELQNMTSFELHSLITRVGENCKIVFCGDIRQTDLNKKYEQSGLSDFYKVIQSMDCFELVEFNVDDIVRSKTVKDYIISRAKLEDEGVIKSLNAI